MMGDDVFRAEWVGDDVIGWIGLVGRKGKLIVHREDSG